ncbi:MAG: hypothetical protein HQM10_04200 [Candidatus Riflebacteria bacterium]|nr:hypothetical protein [Candidatus Riflebacteria bacterium]
MRKYKSLIVVFYCVSLMFLMQKGTSLFAFGDSLLNLDVADSIPCDPDKDFEEVYLLPQWDKIPHKCQQETEERVEEVNKILSTKKWKFNKILPVMACLSFAGSSACDWWALQYGWELGAYRNFYNGKTETGFDPRALEVQYVNRSQQKPREYLMLPISDPIHRHRFPATIIGFAKLMTSIETETIIDQIFPAKKWEFTQGMYPLENNWKLFERKLGKYDELTLEIIKAIHHFGVLYAHIELNSRVRFLPPMHSVLIIGYGKTKEGKTVFIFHDSYGDHPKTYKRDKYGSPSYRCISSKNLENVVAFPHTPIAEAHFRGYNVCVNFTNKGGKPIKLHKVHFRNSFGSEKKALITRNSSAFLPKSAVKDGKVSVYVEAEHYMKDIEKGHWLEVPVESAPQ